MALQYINSIGLGGQLTEPCFCVDGSGRVCWTSGREYTQKGTAQGRVETLFLVDGLLVHGKEYVERLTLATREQAWIFVEKVNWARAAEVALRKQEHEAYVQSKQAEAVQWCARLDDRSTSQDEST